MNIKNTMTTRARSGSFSGTLTAKQSTGFFSSRDVGYLNYHFSATRNEGRINMVENTSTKTGTGVGGVGSALSNQAESLMKIQGATKMMIQPAGQAERFWETRGYGLDQATYQQRLTDLTPQVTQGNITEPEKLRIAAQSTDYWSKTL